MGQILNMVMVPKNRITELTKAKRERQKKRLEKIRNMQSEFPRTLKALKLLEDKGDKVAGILASNLGFHYEKTFVKGWNTYFVALSDAKRFLEGKKITI